MHENKTKCEFSKKILALILVFYGGKLVMTEIHFFDDLHTISNVL